MRVFNEGNFDQFLQDRERRLSDEIRSQPESYILNVNADEFLGYLVSRYELDVPELLRDQVFVDTREEMIAAERFPFTFNVHPGKSYPRPVVRYHVPISGDIGLLRYTPSPRIMWTMEMGIDGNMLVFDVIVWSDDPEPLKREAEDILNKLQQQLAHLANQARQFNAGLASKASSLLESRRQEIRKRSGFVEALGVPLRKREDLPETFAVPPPEQRRRIRPKPQVAPSGPPEPTLDVEAYNEIVRTIWDLGRTMERLPSTYAGKDEEMLRDHILLYLTPRFEGSSTGETFNRAGRTDILLRYENRNVFIAECKFWSGPKAFLKAITQLLGYLTWRDSKACIVLFVRNRDFTAVLDSLKEAAASHEEYGRFVAKRDESWFDYRFRIPGDPDREVWVNVLAFHLPEC